MPQQLHRQLASQRGLPVRPLHRGLAATPLPPPRAGVLRLCAEAQRHPGTRNGKLPEECGAFRELHTCWAMPALSSAYYRAVSGGKEALRSEVWAPAPREGHTCLCSPAGHPCSWVGPARW
eukprot:scaffold1554_cov401-Prasinococcus_capsulatus_cf.AAC.30